MPYKQYKQYIVLSESRHSGWIGGFITLAKAKKLLKIENETFYIFKIIKTKKETLFVKLKYPFCEYYDGLVINEYVEKDDEYVIITYDENYDKEFLILTHKP